MKLLKIKKLEGTIVLKTGLHIGSGEIEMHIGGTDNPVIKHPHTNEPYIPGSSLKGKIRSLLEMESGAIKETGGGVVSGKVLEKLQGEEKEKAEKIIKLFGEGASEESQSSEIKVARVSFSDCFINEEWKKQNEDRTFTELKTENTIDRIKGIAQHPRVMERVPEGVKFDFSLSIKIFDDDNENDLVDYLLSGMKLLEMDALGGSGSRGYGRIEFKFDDEDIQKRFSELKPFGANS
ncbi:MAG: type III-A CRISPR-associated RAMP protein Csm3 [Elusimicrobia bacterium]|nr:type III-A CRISPR-associated RAMP protein Csm3 [Elusimicrobiota bacterium]